VSVHAKKVATPTMHFPSSANMVYLSKDVSIINQKLQQRKVAQPSTIVPVAGEIQSSRITAQMSKTTKDGKFTAMGMSLVLPR